MIRPCSMSTTVRSTLLASVIPMTLVGCSNPFSPAEAMAEQPALPAMVSTLGGTRGPSVYEFTPSTMPGTRCVYVQNGYASGLSCDFAPVVSTPDPAR